MLSGLSSHCAKVFFVLGIPVCLTAVLNPAGGFRVTFDVPVAYPIRGQSSTDYGDRRSFLSRYRPRCLAFTQPCLLHELGRWSMPCCPSTHVWCRWIAFYNCRFLLVNDCRNFVERIFLFPLTCCMGNKKPAEAGCGLVLVEWLEVPACKFQLADDGIAFYKFDIRGGPAGVDGVEI